MDKRDHPIQVVLTDGEYLAFKSKADLVGLSCSAFARTLIRKIISPGDIELAIQKERREESLGKIEKALTEKDAPEQHAPQSAAEWLTTPPKTSGRNQIFDDALEQLKKRGAQ